MFSNKTFPEASLEQLSHSKAVPALVIFAGPLWPRSGLQKSGPDSEHASVCTAADGHIAWRWLSPWLRGQQRYPRFLHYSSSSYCVGCVMDKLSLYVLMGGRGTWEET